MCTPLASLSRGTDLREGHFLPQNCHPARPHRPAASNFYDALSWLDEQPDNIGVNNHSPRPKCASKRCLMFSNTQSPLSQYLRRCLHIQVVILSLSNFPLTIPFLAELSAWLCESPQRTLRCQPFFSDNPFSSCSASCCLVIVPDVVRCAPDVP